VLLLLLLLLLLGHALLAAHCMDTMAQQEGQGQRSGWRTVRDDGLHALLLDVQLRQCCLLLLLLLCVYQNSFALAGKETCSTRPKETLAPALDAARFGTVYPATHLQLIEGLKPPFHSYCPNPISRQAGSSLQLLYKEPKQQLAPPQKTNTPSHSHCSDPKG
jgi:hypothetical protein